MRVNIRKNGSFLYVGIVVLAVLMLTLPVLAENKDSIFQMAGNIQIDKDEIIDGNVETLAGNITIYGTVNGNVVALAGTITIYGKVDGDVRATAGNVFLRNNAEVTGNVTALAGKIVKDDTATVAGSLIEMVEQRVKKGDISFHEDWDVYVSPKIPWYIMMWGALTGLISWLALGALLMLFFARQVQRLAEVTVQRPVYYFLIGLVAYLLVPPVMVLMVITIVGIPAAFLLIIFVILATIIGQLGIARTIGFKVVNRFNLHSKTEMARVLIGVMTMFLITIIPVVGWLFFFVTGCIGFGSALINRFGIEKKGEENHAS